MIQRLIFSIVPPVLLFLLIMFTNRGQLRTPCIRNMDRAYAHLTVETALQGKAYDGAFSHGGFRHPGPVLYYYLALSRTVLDRILPPPGVYRIAILLINCIFLGVAIFLATSLLRAPSYALLLVPLFLAVLGPVPSRLLMDYWNPRPIPAATLVYILALVKLCTGSVSILPLVVFAGSFIAQCHIGTIPFLFATAAYAFGAYFAHALPRGGLSAVKRPMLLSVAVLALLWSMPLLDIFLGWRTSNGSAILAAFSKHHETRPLSISLKFVWHLMATQLRPLVPFLPSIYLPLIVVAALCLPSGRILRPAFKHLRIIALISILVTAISLTQSFQPLAEYLVTYLSAVVALSIFTLCIFMVESAGRVAQQRVSVAKFLPPLVFSFLLFASGAALTGRMTRTPRVKSECPPLKFAQQYAEVLSGKGKPVIRLMPKSERLREFLVFLVTGLLKSGTGFCISDKWKTYFGRALSCDAGGYEGRINQDVTIHLMEPPANRSPASRRHVSRVPVLQFHETGKNAIEQSFWGAKQNGEFGRRKRRAKGDQASSR